MPLSQLPSTLETVRLLALCESDTLAKHAARFSRANGERGERERSRAKEQRIKERARQKWAIAAARSRGSRRVVIALDRYPNMATRHEGVGGRKGFVSSIVPRATLNFYTAA